MQQTRFDCDCDKVIDMQEIGVGVEEILQYSRALLSRDEIQHLITRLRELATAPVEAEKDCLPVA